MTKWLRVCLTAGLFLLYLPSANGQFLKKLGKKAQKAAERTVEQRVDEEASKTTDRALDSILEPGQGGPAESPVPQGGGDDPGAVNDGSAPTTGNGGSSPNAGGAGKASGSKRLEVYSKFDFVPGDETLFYEDFGDDFIGDFPARWNTNGGGEVVTFGDDSGKWLELVSGNRTYYIPDLNDLPEDYTIEFDMEVLGVGRGTSSSATLRVILDDNGGFEKGGNNVVAYIPLVQYTPGGIRVENRINSERTISNTVKLDIRENILNRPHISIAVNGERYRMYVDENKHIDIPRMIGPGAPMTHVKFQLDGVQDGKEKVFISNIKVAKGGEDLRRKLLAEGSISTNAILFDSGSANLQPTSMGVIRQISQVLQQEGGMSLQIVGHTDSDGDADANIDLSQARAESVKKALVDIYGIDAGRLSTLGKGESEPVAENSSPDGKAQNRRVEFIKQ
ncbi:OmpA family protein [Robiginitalea sp. SC105]|uniref:OmpA family protein n=1 Tax=Robiginitalea sp. SC105 TaxID=2762332 RepID=UPI00163AC09A|nr:OmpA family protein [Robiginitalea sp. SC105]MBC2837707.1 OmpA family protein [Robiginitalea sp. SC105]